MNSELVKNDPINTGIVNSQIVNSKFVNKMKYGKVLGIEWDDNSDKLIFRLNEIFKDALNIQRCTQYALNMHSIFKDALNIQPTKRNILSAISTIYDPVGYLQKSPYSWKYYLKKFVN